MRGIIAPGEVQLVGQWKLTREEQFEVCQQLAMYKNPAEVNEHLLRNFNKTLSSAAVYQYKRSKQWQPIIKKYRKQYNDAILDVPIANKRKRLDELQDIYDEFKSKKKLANAQVVLRDAREELEPRSRFGDTYNFSQVNQTLYASMSDEELEQERLKQLEKLKHYTTLAKRAEREGKITDGKEKEDASSK